MIADGNAALLVSVRSPGLRRGSQFRPVGVCRVHRLKPVHMKTLPGAAPYGLIAWAGLVPFSSYHIWRQLFKKPHISHTSFTRDRSDHTIDLCVFLQSCGVKLFKGCSSWLWCDVLPSWNPTSIFCILDTLEILLRLGCMTVDTTATIQRCSVCFA